MKIDMKGALSKWSWSSHSRELPCSFCSLKLGWGQTTVVLQLFVKSAGKWTVWSQWLMIVYLVCKDGIRISKQSCVTGSSWGCWHRKNFFFFSYSYFLFLIKTPCFPVIRTLLEFCLNLCSTNYLLSLISPF